MLSTRNAALPGVCYPMTGLGTRGAGYMLGQTEECWRYPRCCTRDYCPMVNATRDWLRMGGWRIDTGYPFGDRCVTAASLLCSGLSCSPATAAAARPTATRSG